MNPTATSSVYEFSRRNDGPAVSWHRSATMLSGKSGERNMPAACARAIGWIDEAQGLRP